MATRKKAPPKKKTTTKKKIILYTQEQSDFVRFYIEQRLQNAGGAYLRAYPNCKSEDTAYMAASRLIRTDKIRELLKTQIEEATGKLTENLSHQIISMWVTRAFYDPAEIIDDDGYLVKPMKELQKLGLSVCIENPDMKIDKDGGEHTTFKLVDRKESLEQLQKYIGLIKPQPVLNLNVNKDATDLTPEEEKAYLENLASVIPQVCGKK